MEAKPRRIQDKKLLERVRKLPCIVCGVEKDVQPCHVRTRGRGGPDAEFNVIPQCARCHQEQGTMPWREWAEMHPRVGKLLMELGWYFENGKLWNDKLSKGA